MEEDKMYSQEELDAKLAEIRSVSESEKEELEKLRNKDMNFAKLRKKKEAEETKTEADKEAEAILEAERKEAEAKKVTEAKVESDKKVSELLSKKSPNLSDSEQKKALYFYNRLSNGSDDPELQAMFADQAIRAATNSYGDDSTFAAGVHNNGGRQLGNNNNEKQESAGGKAIRESVYGLSKEDAAKYSGDNWKPKYSHVKGPKHR